LTGHHCALAALPSGLSKTLTLPPHLTDAEPVLIALYFIAMVANGNRSPASSGRPARKHQKSVKNTQNFSVFQPFVIDRIPRQVYH
tara:strand:- start:3309 stop:3566 length:258 start_codon:yes stop_codon:yes gene_type:complete